MILDNARTEWVQRAHSTALPDEVTVPAQAFKGAMRLPITQNPLSLNKKMHWATKNKLVKQWRTFAGLHANRWPALPHADATLTWFVTDNRRRDEDNMVGLLKPLCDGLVDAGVVPDDTPQWMGKACRIERAPQGTTEAYMVLTVEYLPTGDAA